MWLKTLGTTAVVIGIALGGTAYAASSKHSGAGAFCWQKAGDTMDCKFASMAACSKAAGSESECIPNPKATTGSGMHKGMQQGK